jgi:membrane protease YdiL (CAAX protease family)
MAVARSRDRSGAGSTDSTWSPTTAGLVVLGAFAAVLVGALVAAVVLTAAGADRQTGTGTLLGSAVAVAATLLIVQRVAGRNPQSTAEQVGLRGMPVPRAAQLLVPAAAAIAVVVVVWGLLVDVNAALPAPDQITGARPIDRLLDGGQARGAIDVDVGIVAGIVGLGVLGPWLAELVLRGVVLPALAAWRGPLVAGIVVSVLGLTTGVGVIVESDLYLCVLALQGVLCLLYLNAGSLLPGIALSSLVTGLALAVSFDWSAPAAIVVAAACAAGSLGLTLAAVRGLALLD